MIEKLVVEIGERLSGPFHNRMRFFNFIARHLIADKVTQTSDKLFIICNKNNIPWYILIPIKFIARPLCLLVDQFIGREWQEQL